MINQNMARGRTILYRGGRNHDFFASAPRAVSSNDFSYRQRFVDGKGARPPRQGDWNFKAYKSLSVAYISANSSSPQPRAPYPFSSCRTPLSVFDLLLEIQRVFFQLSFVLPQKVDPGEVLPSLCLTPPPSFIRWFIFYFHREMPTFLREILYTAAARVALKANVEPC